MRLRNLLIACWGIVFAVFGTWCICRYPMDTPSTFQWTVFVNSAYEDAKFSPNDEQNAVGNSSNEPTKYSRKELFMNLRNSDVPEEQPITVLVFLKGFSGSKQLSDFYFNGNIKEECGFDFDCLFTQTSNFHDVTSNYSAVIFRKPAVWFQSYERSILSGKFHRNAEQIWVFVTMETALNTGIDNQTPSSELINHAFNWSMTYSSKATIFRPWFFVKKSESLKSFEDVKKDVRNMNKSKDFCWIVSNCFHDWAKRRELANALIPLLPSKLHIWGTGYKDCLDDKARENSIDHGPFSGHYMGELYEPMQERIRGCKFYLAFDNSNCSDFVTEKFSNALEAAAIPIVNGWRDSYQQKVPGSFIHVSDFESLANLASHLKFLLQDENALMNYHKWQLKYQIERLHLQPQCELCEKLKELKSTPKKPPSILNLSTINELLQNCSEVTLPN